MIPHPDFAGGPLPRDAVLGAFRLRVLGRADLTEDYAAVISSTHVLMGLFPGDWPNGLTKEDNALDLAWHEKEFDLCRSYIGCCYLFPAPGQQGWANAVFWMRDAPDRQERTATFDPLFRSWLTSVAPDGLKISHSNNGYLG